MGQTKKYLNKLKDGSLDRDEYIEELLGEIEDLKAQVKDKDEAIVVYERTLDDVFKTLGISDESDDDGFYTDDDCESGSIKMQYRHDSGEVELLTPKKRKKFAGVKLHIEPGEGFGIGIVTRDEPR